jgi:hypothetical protein
LKESKTGSMEKLVFCVKAQEFFTIAKSSPCIINYPQEADSVIWQENYINYRPSSIGKDDNGMKRMSLIARAAESIADGDIINVQIRRYRQWQLSQTGSLSSCIIPYVSPYCSGNIKSSSCVFLAL